MGIKEVLKNLGHPCRIKTKEQPSSEENIEILLWDLRNEEKANHHQVAPGYYLTLAPISIEQMKNPDLLKIFDMQMLTLLLENIPRPSSNIRIPVDIKGSFVDPALSWQFSPQGYIRDKKMLVIRAEPVDPDEAQKIIVSRLKKNNFFPNFTLVKSFVGDFSYRSVRRLPK